MKKKPSGNKGETAQEKSVLSEEDRRLMEYVYNTNAIEGSSLSREEVEEILERAGYVRSKKAEKRFAHKS